MDRTSPAAHSGHDELLIARLYGGDVSEPERARALRLVSECPDCGSLFADLGGIAGATAALPVPPRPRDFSLSEADAARWRRKTGGRWRILGLGLRRSLGGSLAALGFFGIIVTSATTILWGAASTSGGGYVLSPERAAAPAVPPAAGGVAIASAAGSSSYFGPASVATAGPLATLLPLNPAASPATSAASPVVDSAASAAPTIASAADSHNLAAASPAAAQGAMVGGSGATKSTEATGSASSGTDPRLAWLIGFAALFVLGLGLAVLPVRRRGRDRGARG